MLVLALALGSCLRGGPTEPVERCELRIVMTLTDTLVTDSIRWVNCPGDETGEG